MSKIFDLEEAKTLYDSGLSTIKLAELYGFKTPKSISDRFKKAGIELRRNKDGKSAKIKPYDSDMFKKIDSKWKAYFIGLLLTDGWITRHSGKDFYDTVGYSSVEKDVIEYISEKTGKKYQTIHRGGHVPGPNGRLINRRVEYRVVMYSREMVQDLARFSVIPNKTFKISDVNLDDDEMIFIPYLIRGIIDGDGTFGFSKHGGYFRIISASEDFLVWCQKALHSIGMEGVLINKIKSRECFFELYSGKSSNMDILVEKVYKEPFGMALKRDRLFSNYVNKKRGV